MNEKSIIIIGGGLTGLSAGCYGRMNGYRTSIFEMHSIAGGVCTAWKRKGYIIDGAVNWVIGTRPGTEFHRFWEELGAAPGWKINNHDLYMVNESSDGKAFYVYCDADRLEEYLLEISAEDEGVIKELTGAIRKASTLSMPVDKPQENYSMLDKVKMIKMITQVGFFKKWGTISIGDFAARFKNPFLREMLNESFGPENPMIMVLFVLGFQHSKSAGYIIGGALALVGSIEKRYLDLGGEIFYNSRVVKILVENNRVVGVRLADGSEHRADWVISAADGRTTIFDMLDGAYLDEKVKRKYDNPNLFQPLVYVGLGVAREFVDLPASIGGLNFPLSKPIVIAGEEKKTINVRSYNFDPTMAPQGKNTLVVQFTTDYDYWHKLRQEQEKYRAEKAAIVQAVIAGLEERFPGITGQVEMTDLATPITWERYTGNWRGSYEGWMFDSDFSPLSSMRKTLPGLKNFFMAGQWVNPGGGIPTAVMSGNHTIQMICKEDKKSFTSSKP
ncbi:MAG: NAD(P)/FAD-dependent oxidoreductase [Bacillota bacterium]